MKRSMWVQRLLVLFLIALPVAPVLWDYIYPGAYARWLLADAANQFDQGNVERSQQLLSKAYDLSPDISQDANFWQQLGRIEFSPENPPSDNSIWVKMVRKIPDPDQRAGAATEIASLMLDRKFFGSALALLEEFLPARKDRSPTQNNLIAYMRSLANTDLDQALDEINLALKGEDNESFLDTKAWILYRMGRYDEALTAIDRSIEILDGKLRANSALEPMLQFMDETVESGAPAIMRNEGKASDNKGEDKPEHRVGWAHQQVLEKFPLVARVSPELLETLATIRFHRMRILEALNEPERAQDDARWLEAFAPKPWDALH
jgi:tetratricopeptide (TPR) repeat protein